MTTFETIGPGPHYRAGPPLAACQHCGGVRWWTSRQHPGRTGWKCITCHAPVSVQTGLLRIETVTPRQIVTAG